MSQIPPLQPALLGGPPPGIPTEFDFQIWYPGEEVTIQGPVDQSGIPKSLKILVYPLGIEHMATFPQEVALILRQITGVRNGPSMATLTPAEQNIRVGRAIAEQVIPILVSRALKLLIGCCSPKIKNPPHWILPPLAEAWCRQSFGASALDPWRAALEKALGTVAGSPVQISALWSRLSSAAATVLKTSSKSDGTTSVENPSHTEDTPTPKSSTGAEEPANSTK